MILEAMKMQNLLKAAFDGRIKTIAVKKGDKVAKGTFSLRWKKLKIALKNNLLHNTAGNFFSPAENTINGRSAARHRTV